MFAEEVEEECGFRVAAADVEWVNNARNSVGKAGNRHCYFYVEVSDSQRVSSGGGIPGEEDIDVSITDDAAVQLATSVFSRWCYSGAFIAGCLCTSGRGRRCGAEQQAPRQNAIAYVPYAVVLCHQTGSTMLATS